MGFRPSRRRFLAGIGLGATAGTALWSPGRPAGSPTLDPTVPAGAWPTAGRDPARTKHAAEGNPPETDARTAWAASVPLAFWGSPVAVDGERVYVAEETGVTALDAADGRERWRFDATDLWPPFGRETRFGPVVTADSVLVTVESRLLALDPATGRVEWARAVGPDPRRAVLVGDVLYLLDAADGPALVAVDVTTGGEWLRFETERHWWPVAFVEGSLVAYDSGRVAMFHPRTGERRWRTETAGGLGEPVTGFAGDDRVVVGSNPLVALDVGDGSEAWTHEFRTDDDDTQSFRPATDGNRVYVSAYDAEATIAFDAATGDVVWRVDERLGHPVVAGETVYCGSEDGIVALDAATGAQRGLFGTGLAPLDGADTLVAAGDRLYVATGPGEDTRSGQTVFALEAP